MEWGKWKNNPQTAFYGVALLLILTRFLHFGPYLDDPHLWRQADTAQYIWSFYHEGIDLFHPSVAWMGGHKTVILEFPLPEAIVAIFQKVFGEGLWVARLVFLLSFALSAFFLYKIIRKLSSETIGQLATLVYLAMPLGLYYSRAIHIDGFATMLVHATLWVALIAIKNRSGKQLAGASAVGTLAILVKAPYLFVILLPLVFYIHQTQSWKWIAKRAYWAIPPLVLFVLWELHRKKVNGGAPDWDFIPNYRKFVDMSGWYFGDMYQRKEWANYLLILGRIFTEILAVVGIVPLLAAILMGRKTKGAGMAWLWTGSAILYVLIFFNLNRIHNYYQLPFLAPLAWGMAIGIEALANRIQTPQNWIPRAIMVGIILFFSFRYAERNYYQDALLYRTAGSYIEQTVPENDLIISTYGGFDPRTPHFLYHAHRYGWSIADASLSPEVIQKLKENGAKWWAFVGNPARAEELKPESTQKAAEYLLPNTGHRLIIFKLD